MSLLFLLSASALLLTAAWHDIATRLIPDGISLWLLALGALARLFGAPSDLAFSVETALLLLALLLILHSRGLIGGGDVKGHDGACGWSVTAGLLPLHCCHRDRGRFARDQSTLCFRARLPAMHSVRGDLVT